MIELRVMVSFEKNVTRTTYPIECPFKATNLILKFPRHRLSGCSYPVKERNTEGLSNIPHNLI